VSAALAAPAATFSRPPYLPGVPDPTEPRGPLIDGLLIRLADEGVPWRAISRATGRMAPYVEGVLAAALRRGELVAMPPPDWYAAPAAPGPDRVAEIRAEIERPTLGFMHLFGIREQEAMLLAALLVRGEVGRPTLLKVVARHGVASQKLLYILVHRVRKALRPHGVQITTLRARGYALTGADRAALTAELGAFRSGARVMA
jgi:hypothetical protein